MRLCLFLICYLVVVFLCFLIFPNSRSVILFRPVIDQSVEPEDDGLNAVRTLVWVDYHIGYSEYSFETSGVGVGLKRSQVDSAKSAQYAHAVEWIKKYNQEKY